MIRAYQRHSASSSAADVCLQDLPDTATMERIAEAWRPYRSVGAYMMWRVPEAAERSPPKKRSKKS